ARGLAIGPGVSVTPTSATPRRPSVLTRHRGRAWVLSHSERLLACSNSLLSSNEPAPGKRHRMVRGLVWPPASPVAGSVNAPARPGGPAGPVTAFAPWGRPRRVRAARAFSGRAGAVGAGRR